MQKAHYFRFEFLRAVTVHSLAELYRCFVRTYCLHLQGIRTGDHRYPVISLLGLPGLLILTLRTFNNGKNASVLFDTTVPVVTRRYMTVIS
jgi:hypothetical protein